MTGAETRTFDVAIIGGGPAGTAAALTLAKYTARRVLIIGCVQMSSQIVMPTRRPACSTTVGNSAGSK